MRPLNFRVGLFFCKETIYIIPFPRIGFGRKQWPLKQCRLQTPVAFNPVAIAPEPGTVALPSPKPTPEQAGTVEIEFATGGRMRITGSVDASTVSALIKALAKTKRRRCHAQGFRWLALMVQEKLKRDPHGGHLFVFRGRRGGLIKVLWHDGQGLCLFAKRLERGRFTWAAAAA
jgi:hypothetical protein